MDSVDNGERALTPSPKKRRLSVKETTLFDILFSPVESNSDFAGFFSQDLGLQAYRSKSNSDGSSDSRPVSPSFDSGAGHARSNMSGRSLRGQQNPSSNRRSGSRQVKTTAKMQEMLEASPRDRYSHMSKSFDSLPGPGLPAWHCSPDFLAVQSPERAADRQARPRSTEHKPRNQANSSRSVTGEQSGVDSRKQMPSATHPAAADAAAAAGSSSPSGRSSRSRPARASGGHRSQSVPEGVEVRQLRRRSISPIKTEPVDAPQSVIELIEDSAVDSVAKSGRKRPLRSMHDESLSGDSVPETKRCPAPGSGSAMPFGAKPPPPVRTRVSSTSSCSMSTDDEKREEHAAAGAMALSRHRIVSKLKQRASAVLSERRIRLSREQAEMGINSAPPHSHACSSLRLPRAAKKDCPKATTTSPSKNRGHLKRHAAKLHTYNITDSSDCEGDEDCLAASVRYDSSEDFTPAKKPFTGSRLARPPLPADKAGGRNKRHSAGERGTPRRPHRRLPRQCQSESETEVVRKNRVATKYRTKSECRPESECRSKSESTPTIKRGRGRPRVVSETSSACAASVIPKMLKSPTLILDRSPVGKRPPSLMKGTSVAVATPPLSAVSRSADSTPVPPAMSALLASTPGSAVFDPASITKSGTVRKRAMRCNKCGPCLTEGNCGVCTNCLDKREFGGKNVKKQACKLRKCINPIVPTFSPSVLAAMSPPDQEAASRATSGPRVKKKSLKLALLEAAEQEYTADLMEQLAAKRAREEQREQNRFAAKQAESARRDQLVTAREAKRVKKLPDSRRLSLDEDKKLPAKQRKQQQQQQQQQQQSCSDERVLESLPTQSSSLAARGPFRIVPQNRDSLTVSESLAEGYAVATLKPVSLPICYLCGSGSAKDGRLQFCAVCCEPMHRYCHASCAEADDCLDVWPQDPSSPLLCLRCQVCVVCNGPSVSTTSLLSCSKCREIYHSSCLPPQHPTKPRKPDVDKQRLSLSPGKSSKSSSSPLWLCPRCILCTSCGAISGTWSGDPQTCGVCAKRRRDGNFCTICERTYPDDDFSLAMVFCATCSHWVHASCQGLSNEQYQILGELPEEAVDFICSVCCGEDDHLASDWRNAVRDEICAGVSKVFTACQGTLSKCKDYERPRWPATHATPGLPALPQVSESAASPSSSSNTVAAGSGALSQLSEKIRCSSYETIGQFHCDILNLLEVIGRNPQAYEFVMMVRQSFNKVVKKVFPWYEVNKSPAVDGGTCVGPLVIKRNCRLPDPACSFPMPSVDHSYAKPPPLQQEERNGPVHNDRPPGSQPGDTLDPVFSTAPRDLALHTRPSVPLAPGDTDGNREPADPPADRLREASSTSPGECQQEAASVSAATLDLQRPEKHSSPTGEPATPESAISMVQSRRTASTGNMDSHLRKLLQHLEQEEDERACCFCGVVGDALVQGRLLLCTPEDWVHFHCALWSSEVYERDDGTLMQVQTALTRARQLRCERCGNGGASIGCCHGRCSRSFHFHCARESQCSFLENKNVFCREHATVAKSRQALPETEFRMARRVVVDLGKLRAMRRFQFGMLPDRVRLAVGGLSVLALGEVRASSDRGTSLLPIGFTSERLFWSCRQPNQLTAYTCSIREEFVPEEMNDASPVVEETHAVEHSVIIHDDNIGNSNKDGAASKSPEAAAYGNKSSQESSISRTSQVADYPSTDGKSVQALSGTDALAGTYTTNSGERTLLQDGRSCATSVKSCNSYWSANHQTDDSSGPLDDAVDQPMIVSNSPAIPEPNKSNDSVSTDRPLFTSQTTTGKGSSPNSDFKPGDNFPGQEQDVPAYAVNGFCDKQPLSSNDVCEESSTVEMSLPGSTSSSLSTAAKARSSPLSSTPLSSSPASSPLSTSACETETANGDSPSAASDSTSSSPVLSEKISPANADEQLDSAIRNALQVAQIMQRSAPVVNGGDVATRNRQYSTLAAKLWSMATLRVRELKTTQEKLLCVLKLQRDMIDLAKTFNMPVPPIVGTSVNSGSVSPSNAPSRPTAPLSASPLAKRKASSLLSSPSESPLSKRSCRPSSRKQVFPGQQVNVAASVANHSPVCIAPNVSPASSSSGMSSPQPSLAVNATLASVPHMQPVALHFDKHPSDHQHGHSARELSVLSEQAVQPDEDSRSLHPASTSPALSVQCRSGQCALPSSTASSTLTGTYCLPSCAVTDTGGPPPCPPPSCSSDTPSRLSPQSSLSSSPIPRPAILSRRSPTMANSPSANHALVNDPKACGSSTPGAESPLAARQPVAELTELPPSTVPAPTRQATSAFTVSNSNSRPLSHLGTAASLSLPARPATSVNREDGAEVAAADFESLACTTGVFSVVQSEVILGSVDNDGHRSSRRSVFMPKTLRPKARHFAALPKAKPFVKFSARPGTAVAQVRIASADGSFDEEGFCLEEVFRKLTERLSVARMNLGLPHASLQSRHASGLAFAGLQQERVVRLLEQFPTISLCKHYQPRFYQVAAGGDGTEDLDVPLKENPHGCARAEIVKQACTYDMFNFLSSRYRVRPSRKSQEASSGPAAQPSNLPESNERAKLTSLDLPLPMRFRQLKKSVKTMVDVYRSDIHGRGLFAKRDIEAQEMVIEYSGQLIRSELTDKREKMYEKQNIGCYMFRIDRQDVVDATMCGNAARFINHSCSPNCYSKIVVVDAIKKIVIFAARRILCGEELTYDYKFAKEDDKIPCTCGADGCRKYLN